MRRGLSSLLAVPLFAGVSLAQSTPCVAGAPVPSYSACPFAAGFVSILGDPGAVVLPFAPCADNDAIGPQGVALPFAFSYFGVAVGAARPTTNGYMKILGPGGTVNSAANLPFPSSSTPQSLVAPFWDDLKTGPATDASTIAYLSSPASFVVEWNNMKFSSAGATGGSPGRNGSVTFQAALFPNGQIEFRYGPYVPPDTSACPPYAADSCGAVSAFPQSGPTASIGLENGDGTVGVDGTGFGAGNAAPPRHNLRFVPGIVLPVAVSYAVLPTGAPPFASIAGQPGTVPFLPSASFALPDSCPPCSDDSSWMRQPSAGPGSPAVGLGALLWPFTLFGAVARTFNMNSNGLLVLGDGLGQDLPANAAPSSPAAPNCYLAPFWDDLEGKATSFAGVKSTGVPGGRLMTFEWSDFGLFDGTSGDCATTANSLRMQVVLHEGSDEIEFRYDHAAPLGGGFSATAAIESATGLTSLAVLPGSANASLPPTNVLLEPCGCGTVRFFGTPCPGTAGFSPRIGTTGVAPTLGSTSFGVTLVDALPGAFSSVALGFGPAPPGGIPVAPPCALFGTIVGTALGGVTTPGPPGSGTRCATIPIPNDPVLSCGAITLQWSVVDFGAVSGIVSMSEAILVRLL
ncbi:MAG TPA: hypothetical protein VFI25_02330 [Planctomycetota bacterium]|jgi:hypothetical protein|nr:hypothetical protein [Planctomycetota bacterium]